MLISIRITTDIKIETLEDLHKLKPLEENSKMKINKSALGRELGKDRRTV